jgi:carbon storage regulator CsrA
MLVLSRKTGEQIHIGDQITVTIVKTQGRTVRIGIEAPRAMRVVRGELSPLSPLPSLASPASVTPAVAPVQGGSLRDRVPSSTEQSGPAPPRTERLPGHETLRQQRQSRPSHPQRWTVSSMRQRVQPATSPRPTAPTARPLHLV